MQKTQKIIGFLGGDKISYFLVRNSKYIYVTQNNLKGPLVEELALKGDLNSRTSCNIPNIYGKAPQEDPPYRMCECLFEGVTACTPNLNSLSIFLHYLKIISRLTTSFKKQYFG